MTKQACAAMEADLQPIIIQSEDDELACCVCAFFFELHNTSDVIDCLCSTS
jgi:hypothetical protein